MKLIISTILIILIFTQIVKSQDFERINPFFLTDVGDSIFIYKEKDYSHKDSVNISIVRFNKTHKEILQTFTSPCSFPYDIETIKVNGQNGFSFKYDPAARHGNKILYLFDEEINRLIEIEAYWKLGMTKSLTIDKQKYLYSYVSCGCADNCWKSILFDIQEFKVDTLAYLSCDCENLIEKTNHKPEKISNNCNKFNDNDKFEKIEKYWTEKVKIGL
ncbi:MAG: hypothetical protein ACERKD_24410 [Prolixibacteraceae bacterium]